MEIVDKIVEFDKYCPTCEHHDLPENEMPCDECLAYPFNQHTSRPINYKESQENGK